MAQFWKVLTILSTSCLTFLYWLRVIYFNSVIITERDSNRIIKIIIIIIIIIKYEYLLFFHMCSTSSSSSFSSLAWSSNRSNKNLMAKGNLDPWREALKTVLNRRSTNCWRVPCEDPKTVTAYTSNIHVGKVRGELQYLLPLTITKLVLAGSQRVYCSVLLDAIFFDKNLSAKNAPNSRTCLELSEAKKRRRTYILATTQKHYGSNFFLGAVCLSNISDSFVHNKAYLCFRSVCANWKKQMYTQS